MMSRSKSMEKGDRVQGSSSSKVPPRTSDHHGDGDRNRITSTTKASSSLEDDEDVGKRKLSDIGQSSSAKRPKINFGLMQSPSGRLLAGSPTSSSTTVKTSSPALMPTSAPISIKLGTQKPKEPARTSVNPLKESIFDSTDDDEEEEMPPEARMRMRNVGRDTPTSTGPNSFGKTNKGFCDTRMIFEKELKKSTRGHDPAGHK